MKHFFASKIALVVHLVDNRKDEVSLYKLNKVLPKGMTFIVNHKKEYYVKNTDGISTFKQLPKMQGVLTERKIAKEKKEKKTDNEKIFDTKIIDLGGTQGTSAGESSEIVDTGDVKENLDTGGNETSDSESSEKVIDTNSNTENTSEDTEGLKGISGDLIGIPATNESTPAEDVKEETPEKPKSKAKTTKK